MSKNNVVIITTRWMDAWNDPDEGKLIPIHRSAKSKFVEKDIMSADRIADYLNNHPEKLCEGGTQYFSLIEGLYSVYVVPCFKKTSPCSDPQEWVRALVYQFSQPGDCVHMMIHASSDLGTDLGFPPSPEDISDREVKIRAFGHSSDIASLILREDTYTKVEAPVSAEQITRYVASLFVNLRSYSSALKTVWQDYKYGDATIDDVRNVYKQLSTECSKENDLRGRYLKSLEEFVEKARKRECRDELSKWINQLTSKF